MITKLVLRLVEKRMRKLTPEIITDSFTGRILIARYPLLTLGSLCVRAHVIVGDDPRHPHDHPWWWMSWVLDGGYWEYRPEPAYPHRMRRRCGISGPSNPFGYKLRQAGSIVFRSALSRHRLQLAGFDRTLTLFIHGRTKRDWGFWLPGETFMPVTQLAKKKLLEAVFNSGAKMPSDD